jgi:hypothetical protein
MCCNAGLVERSPFASPVRPMWPGIETQARRIRVKPARCDQRRSGSSAVVVSRGRPEAWAPSTRSGLPAPPSGSGARPGRDERAACISHASARQRRATTTAPRKSSGVPARWPQTVASAKPPPSKNEERGLGSDGLTLCPGGEVRKVSKGLRVLRVFSGLRVAGGSCEPDASPSALACAVHPREGEQGRIRCVCSIPKRRLSLVAVIGCGA